MPPDSGSKVAQMDRPSHARRASAARWRRPGRPACGAGTDARSCDELEQLDAADSERPTAPTNHTGTNRVADRRWLNADQRRGLESCIDRVGQNLLRRAEWVLAFLLCDFL